MSYTVLYTLHEFDSGSVNGVTQVSCQSENCCDLLIVDIHPWIVHPVHVFRISLRLLCKNGNSSGRIYSSIRIHSYIRFLWKTLPEESSMRLLCKNGNSSRGIYSYIRLLRKTIMEDSYGRTQLRFYLKHACPSHSSSEYVLVTVRTLS